jgi:hypothetical protein
MDLGPFDDRALANHCKGETELPRVNVGHIPYLEVDLANPGHPLLTSQSLEIFYNA